MGTADLSDRVVAVADEDALVQACGALALHPVEGALAGGDIPGELLQEQPSQSAGIARVAREHRTLDRLREVDQGEDGPVEVGEMGLEKLALGGGEFLGRVPHAGDRSDRGGGAEDGRMYRPGTARRGVEFLHSGAGYGPHPGRPGARGVRE